MKAKSTIAIAIAFVLIIANADLGFSQTTEKRNYERTTETIDFTKREKAKEMNHVVFTKNGLELIENEQIGYYISKKIKILLKNPEPFISFSAAWTASNYFNEYMSIQFRTFENCRTPEKWEELTIDEHYMPEGNRYVSQMHILNKAVKYIQYRITFLQKTTNISLNTIELHFSSPGKMKDDTEQGQNLKKKGNNGYVLKKACPCPLPSYINRVGWGCPQGENSPVHNTTSVTHLIVHHQAGSATSPYDAVVWAIWDQHVNTNLWADIGYNWLIDPDGVLYKGRAWNGGNDNVIGAHMCGCNSSKMGVCLLGDFTSTTPTAAAYNTLVQLLGWKSCDVNISPTSSATTSSKEYSTSQCSPTCDWPCFTSLSCITTNMDRISGHRDGCKDGGSFCTSCPGNSFYPQMAALRTDVDNLINSPGCTGVTPPNDSCSGAIQFPSLQAGICVNITLGEDVAGATESLPPNPTQCSGCGGCSVSSSARDVWFKFTAITNTHTIELSNLNVGDFDAVIEIRRGPTCNGAFEACYDSTGQPASMSFAYGGYIPNDVYFVRIYDWGSYSNQPTVTTFDICVNSPACAPPFANAATTAHTTCGDNNGAVSAAPSGGTAPYTYLWNNGCTSSTCTGLPAGVYTVTVTDANGCTSSVSSTTVNSSTGPTATAAKTDVTCNGNSDGTATANSSGGTPPYSYLWSNSQTTQTVTGLPTGTYTVTVTDNAGCPSSPANITITEPSAINISTTTADASCGGSDGSITVTTVTGGTNPYTCSIDGINFFAVPKTFSGLSAGTYTVTAKDANSCTGITNETVGNINGPTVFISSSTNVSCSGGSDGQAVASPTGGTQPYTYLWNTTPQQTTATATGLSADSYTVVVSDAGGCSGSDNITITEPQALTASATGNTINCGATNGAATVSASGGTAPYTYLWSDPNNQTSVTATGLAAGSYVITVTDANGCSAIGTATISNVGGPTVTTSVTDDTKGSPNCDGTATVTATGGTSPYTYLWSNGQTSSTATGLCAGVYDVTTTDNSGCTSMATVTLTQNTTPCTTFPPQPTIQVSGNTLTAYSVANVTYQWYLNNSLIPGATSQTHTDTANGFYEVEVTDSNGCSSMSEFTYCCYVGIDDNTFFGSLNLYPNPTPGKFTLELQVKEPKEIHIKILNTLGQEVKIIARKQLTSGNNLLDIDMTGYAKGAYTLQIIFDGGTINRQIVIE